MEDQALQRQIQFFKEVLTVTQKNLSNYLIRPESEVPIVSQFANQSYFDPLSPYDEITQK